MVSPRFFVFRLSLKRSCVQTIVLLTFQLNLSNTYLRVGAIAEIERVLSLS